MPTDLTERHVQILLVLAEGPSHGYAVAKEIEARTGGGVVLKPGSMYRALHQLLVRRCLEEVEVEGGDEDRRREYRVTPTGRGALRQALEHYRGLVRSGERLGVVRGHES